VRGRAQIPSCFSPCLRGRRSVSVPAQVPGARSTGTATQDMRSKAGSRSARHLTLRCGQLTRRLARSCRSIPPYPYRSGYYPKADWHFDIPPYTAIEPSFYHSRYFMMSQEWNRYRYAPHLFRGNHYGGGGPITGINMPKISAGLKQDLSTPIHLMEPTPTTPTTTTPPTSPAIPSLTIPAPTTPAPTAPLPQMNNTH
jgi:hypothetical protein